MHDLKILKPKAIIYELPLVAFTWGLHYILYSFPRERGSCWYPLPSVSHKYVSREVQQSLLWIQAMSTQFQNQEQNVSKDFISVLSHQNPENFGKADSHFP